MERQYKDSGIEWIGRIPKEWNVDIAKRVFKQRREKGNDVECQLLAATQKNGMYPQHLLEGVVKVAADTDLNLFKTVHKNDYVISLRSFQGGFEMSDFEGVCSPAYQVFYAICQTASQYYKYLFKSDAFIQEINSLTVGIREGKNILYDDFALLPIPIPPYSEQQQIADYLDKKCAEIDGLIDLQEQMIAQLTDYKQSVITEAVTKGLNPNAELVPSGIDWIGEIPKEWSISQLKRFVSFQNGQDYKEIEVAEGFPVYGSGGIFAHASQYMYDGESILFGRKGTINKPLYINCKFWTVDTMYYTIPKKGVCAKFIYYVATTLPYDKYSTSTALPSMTQTILGNLKIAVPSLVEQQSIASYLDEECYEIDSLIALKQQKIEALKDYKKSIIYEAVTGKTVID